MARDSTKSIKLGTYFGFIIIVATLIYIIVHVKISTVLDEAHSVTKMITNKYTSFRHHHDSSESLIDTYQSSSSSSSKSKSSSILSSKESAYDQKHPNSQAVDTTKSKSTATPPSTANTAFTSSSGATKLYTTKHPILALSDDEFLSTPLDVMLSWYDAATTGAATCDDDFGNGLIKRWRSKKSTFCSTSDSSSLLTTTADTTVHSHKKLSPSSLSSSSSSSHITCYLIKQANHYGNGDNICVMNNVSVNMGIFSDDSIIRPVVKTYVDTRHDDQPYVHFEKGFIQGTCSPVNDQWQSKFMPGWNEDWTTSSYQQIDNTNKNSQLGEGTCDEWIDHPVLIVQRDTFANFFHDSEDFINVFIAMTVLQMKFENIQIYLTDLYPKGPFWPIWAKTFSGKYPVLDAWDLRQRFGKSPQHRVCYRDLTVGIYGPAAPITIHTWETPCRGTALVKAYSDFIIRGLKLQEYTHYAQPKPLHTVTVTYLARRASTVWPEKKYCNDTHSFFLCRLWQDWGIRSLGRMVGNDQELVSTLKSLESKTYKNNARVVFQDVDYNLLSFEDQIKMDLKTDILVGPHGAGLMHNIYMSDRATLIELSVDGSGSLRHFFNLAHWYGRKYIGLNVNNPIDISSLMVTIESAIEEINLNQY